MAQVTKTKLILRALEWSAVPPPAMDPKPGDLFADGVGGFYTAQRNGLLWMAHDPFIWAEYGSQKEAMFAAEFDHARRVRALFTADESDATNTFFSLLASGKVEPTPHSKSGAD